MDKDKPLSLSTLSDYNDKILKPMVGKLALDIAYGILTPNGFIRIEDLPPLTRMQKFKRWREDKKQRIKDIWTILSGGDIHENCDYY